MFSIKLIIKNQKGVSILLAILIMSVILSIGLGISTILVQQTKMMGTIGNSVIAFFAADSGIEQVLILNPLQDIPETSMPNGATYQVDVEEAGVLGCNAPNYCIKSTGTYKNIKRAIEVKF